jgi:oligopeptide/dipeptide ABC transporter ATP-binding protein
MTPLLEVRDLRVRIALPSATVTPVDGVTFSVERGEMLALVGESGAGKSLTCLALLQLLPAAASLARGSTALLDGEDILALKGEALRRIRGKRIAIVFQDAGASLNPVLTVGDQVRETVQAHLPVTRTEARARAISLLGEMGLPDPAAQYQRYPHQLSGGMRQRVMLAIALAAEPELLIADEPTSALDVTIQAQILELIDRERRSRGLAVLLVSHDLGVVASRADRVAVLYAGQIVEQATTRELFGAPAHPYTRGLLAAIPRLRGPFAATRPMPGSVPDPAAWPSGCRFGPRCPERFARCDTPPEITRPATGHSVRCWLSERAP